MKVDSEIKKWVTKGDIILIVSLILISVFLFAFSFIGTDGGLCVKVYSDSKLVFEGKLSENENSQIITANGCEILVEKDGVSFLHSDCADQLCVKRGKLTKKGDSMACVPKKVAVVITANKDKSKIDALTY